MPDVFVSKKDLSAPAQTHAAIHKKVHSELKEKNNFHPLAAFCYLPARVRFETQDKEEKIILFLRKHPVTNVPWIIISIFMLIAPAALSIFPIIAFLPANFQLFAVFGWYLITAAYILENFLSWYFNVNIVTDERIIDIDFENLIYKQVSDAKIDRIEDTTFKMGGVIRTIFNYGDVLIQTAGEVPEFEMLAVPQPNKVVEVLNDLMLEEEQEKIEGRVR